MKQHNTSNESLVQLLNHKDLECNIYPLFRQGLLRLESKGLLTPKERESLSMKASLVRTFLYEQFVAIRHELNDVYGYPLRLISDDNLLDMLISGQYSWDELVAMNDDVRDEMMAEIEREERLDSYWEE